MTDVQALLHEALGDLPGGPIIPPVGLGLRAERLRVRRRRAQVAGAAVVAVVVAGTSAVAGLQGSTGASAPLTPGGQPVASPGDVCEVPSTLTLAGPEVQPVHTAAEARDALYGEVNKRNGELLFAGAGAAYAAVRAGDLVWAVERLNGRPGGAPLPMSGGVEFFRDADLAPVGALECDLLPVLQGATVDPQKSTAIVGLPDRAPFAVSPVEPLTRDQASTPWTGRGMGDQLIVSFGTGCHDNATVQVKQTVAYVLIQVVRNGPRSGLLCGGGQSGTVLLDQPLGTRLLLHAAVRDLLPSTAADRVPSYLPEGTTPLALPSVPPYLRAAWKLPDGRILSYFVGVSSPPDAAPEIVSMAGYGARFFGVRGNPTLQWQEGDATLQVRLTPAVGRPVVSPLTELKRVAESLYTSEYVALRLADAEALAASYGLESRVVKRDGKDLAVFGNYNPRRVDLDVVDGTVTAARFG